MKNNKKLILICAAVIIVIVLLLLLIPGKTSTVPEQTEAPVQSEEHYAELPEISVSDYTESDDASSAKNSPDLYETEKF